VSATTQSDPVNDDDSLAPYLRVLIEQSWEQSRILAAIERSSKRTAFGVTLWSVLALIYVRLVLLALILAGIFSGPWR
jgi:hypothetical protein